MNKIDVIMWSLISATVTGSIVIGLSNMQPPTPTTASFVCVGHGKLFELMRKPYTIQQEERTYTLEVEEGYMTFPIENCIMLKEKG